MAKEWKAKGEDPKEVGGKAAGGGLCGTCGGHRGKTVMKAARDSKGKVTGKEQVWEDCGSCHGTGAAS